MSTVTSAPTVMAMLAALEHRSTSAAARESQAEQERNGHPRRDCDRQPATARRRGGVGERADRARAGCPDRRHERRENGDGDGDGDHEPDRREVERRRAGRADEAGARIRQQGRGQPSDHEPDRCRHQGERDLLSQEDRGHERGSRADGLQQTDASSLLLHPAAHEQRDARQGEEPEQRAPGEEDRLLDRDDQAFIRSDRLPGDERQLPTRAGARRRRLVPLMDRRASG